MRESAWWGVGEALAGLKGSGVSWEDEAVRWIGKVVLKADLEGEPVDEESALGAKEWTVEKVAVALRLMINYPVGCRLFSLLSLFFFFFFLLHKPFPT